MFPPSSLASCTTWRAVPLQHPLAANMEPSSAPPHPTPPPLQQAIHSLCLKFPAKHRVLMNFLSNVLRDEGGFEYKKAIVQCILALIQDIPEAKDPGLAHLCEFIEDCEFTFLSAQILHLLGVEGPKTKEPSKYIRYIYNRWGGFVELREIGM